MFTKDKILRFLLALAVFAAADAWVYGTLRGAVRDSAAAERARKLGLLAKTLPDAGEGLDAWFSSVGQALPGGAALYLSFPEDDPYAYRVISGDAAPGGSGDEAAKLWAELESTADAERGLEAAYYMEEYASNTLVDFKGERARLFFSPKADEAGSEVVGIAVFIVPETSGSAIERLLGVFALGSLVLFAALTGISSFTRDRTVGYAVLVLAAIAGVFILYPLGEALRLSFFEGGRFSFATWGRALSGSSLKALWGSIRLGIWTASTSTILGFLFAFAIHRTSMRGKRFLSAIAQLPVISPPFSLTLSIILLAGNNEIGRAHV